jgi:hypothetical protein
MDSLSRPQGGCYRGRYSLQILLFGAELTQVYANQAGRHVKPSVHAIPIETRVVEKPKPNS